MPITSVDGWSTTANLNSDVNGNSIAENCSPAGINNAIRGVMAQAKTEFDTITPTPVDKTALRAVDTTTKIAALLDGDIWLQKTYSDFTTIAAADNADYGAQYLRSTFDTSRVWARAGETISLRTFGSIEPYRNDNSAAAFNNAIEFLNVLPHGATLTVPSGRYTVDGALTAISSNGKYIVGERGTRISHDGGILFTWGAGVDNGVVDGGLVNIDYLGSATPTAGTGFIKQDGMNRLLISGIRGTYVKQLLTAGPTASAGGYFINDVRITTVNEAGTVILNGKGANSVINGLDMTATGVNRVIDRSTLVGGLATAIGFGSGNWDTAVWQGLLTNGYGYGLDINRTTTAINVSNFRVSNFYFDYCSDGVRLLNTSTGGGINNMMFSNGWVVGMDGRGVHLDGSVGSHRSIVFNNVHALLGGKQNWRLNSQTMDNVQILGCTGDFGNRLSGNTGADQDDFVALYGGWECRNSRFGRSGATILGVAGLQARYGATMPTAAADYVFEGNQAEGASGAVLAAIAGNSITAGKLYSSSVKGNRVPGGATRVDYATIAAVTAPTSAAVQTNNTPFHYTLYIYAGTVTAVFHNGTTVGDGAGPSTLEIKPGDTWAVTYSVAPTIKRMIHQ